MGVGLGLGLTSWWFSSLETGGRGGGMGLQNLVVKILCVSFSEVCSVLIESRHNGQLKVFLFFDSDRIY
jgi:hypothetical protein